LYNDQKKLRQFGHNDRKYRLVNNVTASFGTIMGQMTEAQKSGSKQNSRVAFGLDDAIPSTHKNFT